MGKRIPISRSLLQDGIFTTAYFVISQTFVNHCNATLLTNSQAIESPDTIGSASFWSKTGIGRKYFTASNY